MPNTVTASVSYYQDQLSRDERFIRRLQQHLMKKALDVMAEAKATTNHAQRVAFAHTVRQNPDGAARQAAFIIVNATGLAGNFTIVDGVPNNTITDANLITEISNMWDTLSGVETGV